MGDALDRSNNDYIYNYDMHDDKQREHFVEVMAKKKYTGFAFSQDDQIEQKALARHYQNWDFSWMIMKQW